MWIFGVMTYLFPRLLRRPWYSRQLAEWHFWLSAVGVFVMWLDLTFAGVFQGFWWVSLQPWMDSINGAVPFWITRLFAGLAMAGGFGCFLVNLYKTWRMAPVSESEETMDLMLEPATV